MVSSRLAHRRSCATARGAIQWLYFGYLAATKEQNGAAMSLGRTSTFLDIYLERDLANGTLTETQAQLRRHLSRHDRPKSIVCPVRTVRSGEDSMSPPEHRVVP